MSDNSTTDLDAFIASIDAELGKKPRQKRVPDHKDLNREFHKANPRSQYAKGQVESLKFENFYDWEVHRKHLGMLEAAQAAGVPELQWLPEARVTVIVNQRCACCASTVQFVGNEYIRFRGRRRQYRDINGTLHWTYPTALKRVQDVDGNLIAYGQPDGTNLPDERQEQDEIVPRCSTCVNLERDSLNLWQMTSRAPQLDMLDESSTKPAPRPMTGMEIRAFVIRSIGTPYRKPKVVPEINLD